MAQPSIVRGFPESDHDWILRAFAALGEVGFFEKLAAIRTGELVARFDSLGDQRDYELAKLAGLRESLLALHLESLSVKAYLDSMQTGDSNEIDVE